MPLGLQLIGRPWEEGELLNTAYALEKAARVCGENRQMVVEVPKDDNGAER